MDISEHKGYWRVCECCDNYEVSRLGEVRNIRTGKILKPFENGNGYLKLKLCKNGVITYAFVHRLVATAFIPNPDNLPQVNHKDENGYNNRDSNLEWVTEKENCNYGTRNARISDYWAQRREQIVC